MKLVNLLLFKSRAKCQTMHNSPYDIQMMSMFIFITVYLVMEVIF